MRFYEERILHVTCRMVVSKIHARIHMPVVLNLRTFSQGETETRENVYYLIFDNSDRMAASEGDGIGSAGEINACTCSFLCGQTLLESVDTLLGKCLELVDFYTDLLLHFRRYTTEILHQLGDEAFLR